MWGPFSFGNGEGLNLHSRVAAQVRVEAALPADITERRSREGQSCPIIRVATKDQSAPAERIALMTVGGFDSPAAARATEPRPWKKGRDSCHHMHR
ncbi:protein of unknown function, partial [uncultured Woeseiaceae bacterium]